MKRIEIILSTAIEEDFITKCEENEIQAYTKLVDARGIGNSVPKQGDAVWPQFNTLFIIYCNDEKVDAFKTVIGKLREQYPSEGIACFVLEASVLEV